MRGMRRVLAVLAIVCLGLVAVGSGPVSAAGTDLNQQVSGGLSYMDSIDSHLCMATPGTPPLFLYEMPYKTSTDEMGILRLGLCDLIYKQTTIIDQYTTRYTYTGVGAFEIVTPDGDTVRGDVTGIYTVTTGVSKNQYTTDLTMTKTFGTGDFEHATGTLHVAGQFFFGGGVDGHPGHIAGTLAGSLSSK